MSDYKHGESVTLEIEATVIEEFSDGTIDVNLDKHGDNVLGGINLFVDKKEIKVTPMKPKN